MCTMCTTLFVSRIRIVSAARDGCVPPCVPPSVPALLALVACILLLRWYTTWWYTSLLVWFWFRIGLGSKTDAGVVSDSLLALRWAREYLTYFACFFEGFS